jgi:formylglycine-generating enzyme required for sulfatase activity
MANGRTLKLYSLAGLMGVAALGAGCGGSSGTGAQSPEITERCIEGQIQNESTAGHCCWPGQTWALDRCSGAPSCPEGLVVEGDGCGCEGGRVVTMETAGQCCFPGQVWSGADAACAGVPTACPEGTILQGDDCLPGGWVAIPGGTFTMGTDEGAPEEGPPHEVTLSPYEIWRTEVTVAQYVECVEAGACPAASETVEWRGVTPQKRETYSALCNITREGRENHPLNCVDWETAKTFCEWKGGRLPTEAEWELAARGTDGRMYPWGSEPPTVERLNACDEGCRELAEQLGREWEALFEGRDGFSDTAPVGSYPAGASPYGLLDVSGNVWEWVHDRAGRYSRRAATNPTGPNGGRDHITRGGAWDDDLAELVRTTTRDVGRENLRDVNVGFRCVRTAPEGGEAGGTP